MNPTITLASSIATVLTALAASTLHLGAQDLRRWPHGYPGGTYQSLTAPTDSRVAEFSVSTSRLGHPAGTCHIRDFELKWQLGSGQVVNSGVLAGNPRVLNETIAIAPGEYLTGMEVALDDFGFMTGLRLWTDAGFAGLIGANCGPHRVWSNRIDLGGYHIAGISGTTVGGPFQRRVSALALDFRPRPVAVAFEGDTCGLNASVFDEVDDRSHNLRFTVSSGASTQLVILAIGSGRTNLPIAGVSPGTPLCSTLFVASTTAVSGALSDPSGVASLPPIPFHGLLDSAVFFQGFQLDVPSRRVLSTNRIVLWSTR